MARALALLGVSGSRVGETTVVTGRSTIIGSTPGCDMILLDRLILPLHAELRTILDRWFIVPLDPRATVFVNGEPVTSQQRIEEGSLITLGMVTFKASLESLAERQVGGGSRW